MFGKSVKSFKEGMEDTEAGDAPEEAPVKKQQKAKTAAAPDEEDG